MTGCDCSCHNLCTCDLGLSVGTWMCRRHENAHCDNCRPKETP